MQKSKDTTSIVDRINNYSVLPQFLDITHYKTTQQNTRKGIAFYESLCKILENNYRLILQLPDKCGQVLASKSCIDRWEIGKFKLFLSRMFQIFNMVSQFQIEGLSRLRTTRQVEDNSEITFNDFTLNVGRYEKQQLKLQENKKNYKIFIQSMDEKSIQTTKRMKKMENYYNIKLLNSELTLIQSNLKEKSQLQEEIAQQSQTVARNTKEFEQQLMFYRQQLIIRKYENIDRISRLCKNSKQSLVEMFSYLYEYVKHQQDLFTKKKITEDDSILSSRTEANKISDRIISQASAYQKVIKQYLVIMKGVIDCFAAISGEAKELKNKQNELIQGLLKYYEYNECDLLQIKLTLNLYTSFLKLIGQLGDKLVFSYNNLLQLQKNVNKCTQMTLTLIKCSQRKRSPTHGRKENLVQRDKRAQDSLNGLDMLKDQLSEVYINNIINKIYEDFSECSLKIRDQFQCLNPYKKKKLQNSMSMSYISQSNIPLQKRPFKKDLWLWKDCKEEFMNTYIDLDKIQKLCKELQLISEKYKQQDKEIQKLNCTMKKKKVNGLLKLKQKSMVFESFDNNYILFVPMIQIENVDIELKMMTKIFKLQTQKGSLQFVDQTQGDIKKFYVNTQKAVDSFHQRANGDVQIQQKMVLSEDQLEFIKKRRVEIEKDIQNTNQYEHFNSLVLHDTHIVDFYRNVYSGNPITFGGKEYENFQATLVNKYSNFNQKYYDFNKPPPSYYSGVQGVNFYNCSLYSQKAMEYDHKLPKMPMLPQTCHNYQTMRFYWISHEQFHLRETNKTSNAPFTENFYLVELFIVKQNDNNVEINFYMKIVQLTDFSFKGMIYRKAKQQAKFGITIFIEQVKKVMAKFRKREGSNGKEAAVNDNGQNSRVENSMMIRQFKVRIQKLQTKNRVLLYVLIAVLLLNLILRLF